MTERSCAVTMSSCSMSCVLEETTISVSTPSERISLDWATVDQTQFSLCEIDPANPSGQMGERSSATPTSCETFQ